MTVGQATAGQATAEQAPVGQAPSSEIVQAELVESPESTRRNRRRRVLLPVVLFLLTCLSTFFAGATGWWPPDHMSGSMSLAPDPFFQLPARLAVLQHWREGLTYMLCVLAILLTHEMGHFVLTLVYGVRSSLPYFLPLPISPIGTMGAVIGMDGSRADRRQIFDIGLAGPIAGLIVAMPIVWIGVSQLDFTHVTPAGHQFGLPLALRWLVTHLHPGTHVATISQNQLNPYFMAGWVGLLVTGLNMMPVSQLDGGHVTYALFGRSAHWLARGFMLFVFIYMGVMYTLYQTPPTFLLMAILVLLIGTDHPPTRDDSVQLGWPRILIGTLSLAIPVLCLVTNPII